VSGCRNSMKWRAFIVLSVLLDIQISLASINQTFVPVDSTLKPFFEQNVDAEKLNFPRSTFRFYQKYNFQYVWLNPANAKTLTEAVRLLSCVSSFGLNQQNYHPDIVAEIQELSAERSNEQKEVLFSDALITFIEHLHFGVANPDAPAELTDANNYKGFKAEDVVAKALKGNFREVVLKVQPNTQEYILLQSYLDQLTGRFTGECRELTTDTLKLISINLERYRWQNDIPKEFYVEINIPAFLLRIKDKLAVSEFKVVVGKPINSTPQLRSSITYLNTTPDWNVPSRIFINELLPKIIKDPSFAYRNNFIIYDRQGHNVDASIENLKIIRDNPTEYNLKQASGYDNALGQIVFRFDNTYLVYLHDTPEKSYFLRPMRALSHGCIRVENPKKVLSLLLSCTGAGKEVYDKITGFMNTNIMYTYSFLRPIPIYIRYITCEVNNRGLIIYKDVYNKDKALKDTLFN